jgi:hypothetical protein
MYTIERHAHKPPWNPFQTHYHHARSLCSKKFQHARQYDDKQRRPVLLNCRRVVVKTRFRRIQLTLNTWIGEQRKIFFQGDYIHLLTSTVIKYQIFP